MINENIIPLFTPEVNILLYQHKNDDDLKSLIFRLFYPELLDNEEKLCFFINENNFLNTLCIDDYQFSWKEFEISNSITNLKRDATIEHYHKNIDYTLKFFYITDSIYNSIFSSGDINLVNPAGKIFLFSKERLLCYKNDIMAKYGSMDLMDMLVYDKSASYDKYGIKIRSGYQSLQGFLAFLLKNGKILFSGRKEDFGKDESIYREVTDLKTLNLSEDIDAIIRYTLLSSQLNIYRDSSLWAEHFLNKIPDGITVVDEDSNVIYSNEQRRKRHKNNVLGKKCFDVFNENRKCDHCAHKIIFEDQKFHQNTGDRHEHKIKDKAGNDYWIIENSISAHVRCYNRHIAIIDCKDINFRHELAQLNKEIQRIDRLEMLYQKIENTFLNKLNFSNLRLYLNFSKSNELPNLNEKLYSKNSPVIVLVHSNNPSDVVVYREHLEEPIYTADTIKFQTTKETISAFDILYEGKQGNIYIQTKKNMLKEPRLFEIFDKVLQIDEMWLDIPLWDGNNLIGVIGVDFGKNLIKWKHITNDKKEELINGGFFLASAISNLLQNRISVHFQKLSERLSEIKKTNNIEKEICKTINEYFKSEIDKTSVKTN